MLSPSAKMGLLVAGVVLLAAALGVFVTIQQPQQLQPTVPGLLWPEPKSLGAFALTDQNNEPFTVADLHGKWSLLFFGFTHCPDICPATLAVMDQAHPQFERDRDVQFVFVSVDPERDTPERLQQYLTSFNPEFVGLGGSSAQVAGLTGQIGLPYFVDKTAREDNYLVDHGASLFMIDPLGRLVGILPAPHDAAGVTNSFRRIRAFIENVQ